MREDIFQVSILKKKMSLFCKLGTPLTPFILNFAFLKYSIGVKSREKSHFKLVAQDKNLVTKEDCEKVASFKDYLDRYEDQSLGCSIADAKRGGLCC